MFVFGIVFLGASRWPPQIVIRDPAYRESAMTNTEPLFVGTANHVHAIDRATGAILWHRELDTRFFKFGNNFVNLYFDGSSLFAATFAKVYCLDPKEGTIQWQASLEGSVLNPTTFASSASFNAEAAWNKVRIEQS